MRSTWKIALPAVCVVAIAGAALAWHVHKTKAAAAKLTETARVTRVSAEQGSADAEVKLGYLYFYGRGVPQDYSQSLRWFKKAADQGYAKGEDDYGSMYQYGNGVPRDYAQALPWYRKAADQGDPWAEDGLGGMYYYGQGVSQDYAEALRWYRKAAGQGYAYAQTDLGDVYYGGKAVPQDYATAALWYRKAADQGNLRGERELADMYRLGRGVPQDYAEAARWYRKAADQGNMRAEYDLGYMYHYGQGVPRSLLETRRLYLNAAAQGDPYALRAITCGLTTTAKVSLGFEFVAGLFFAVGFIRFRLNYFADPQKPFTLSQKLTAAAGALLLLCAAYGWYGYRHLKFRNPLYGPNAWDVGRWTLLAAAVCLLLYTVRLDRQREAKESGRDPPDVATSEG